MEIKLDDSYSLQSTVVNANELIPVETSQLTIETGLEALAKGEIIFAKEYDWAKNDSIYFRLNEDTGLTEIAYSINHTNGKTDYWSSFNVPINIFNQTECYVYLPIQASLKYNVGDTITYMNTQITAVTDTTASLGTLDSAIVEGVYQKDNEVYYKLSREPDLFVDEDTITTTTTTVEQTTVEPTTVDPDWEGTLVWHIRRE